jgi:DNA-binding response OmpR family regulator
MKRVLIIDDEKDICLLLQSFLQKYNYHIRYACELEEGTAQFFRIPPDILILDNNLPDGYGLDRISLFKQKNPGVKLVMISAMSGLREKALQQGADCFLKKPFSLDKITSILTYQVAS